MVFDFLTKVDDIKAHFSIYAMMNELPEPETREFIRKNHQTLLREYK